MKIFLLLLASLVFHAAYSQDNIISYVAKNKQQINLYWKDGPGRMISTIENLVQLTGSKKKRLLFAMNGGMFTPEYKPVGLYIENNRTLTSLNHVTGGGNFGLKPNGVFYLTSDNKALICKTEDFKDNGKIKYATQSGPMLLIDGQIHPAFKAGSSNLNIRNGVGILPDGSVLFAISKIEINFYDFAMFFKNQGCKNALYLDGFVSQMYCPEKNMLQTDGKFGVIIGVVVPE